MRRHLLMLPALLMLASCAALSLPGCSSGFGRAAEPKGSGALSHDGCSACDLANAAKSVPGGASAAAEGGQRASTDATQGDNVPLRPLTVVASGSDASPTVSPTQTDERRLSGAPSVNQGLVLPTAADARTGGTVNPVVASLQLLVNDLREQLRASVPGDTLTRDALLKAISDAHDAMAKAQASAQATTHNVYNFDGAKIVQTVGNSSNSGEGTSSTDGPSGTPAAARMVEKVGAAAMAGPESLPPTTDPSSPPVSPLGDPPAGAPK